MAVEIDLWAYLVFSCIVVLTIERLMSLFLGKRKTSLVVFIGSFLFVAVAASTAFLFLNIIWVTMVVNLTTYSILSLNYEGSIQKKMASVIGTLSTLWFLETSLGVLWGYHLTFSEGSVDGASATFLVFLGVSSYLFALLLSYFKNIKKARFSSPVAWLAHLVIPVSSFVLASFTALLPSNIVVFIIIVLYIMNVTTFYFQDRSALAYEEKLKSALDSQEKEYYFVQNELMIETVETVKSIRHDMKLHLATLENYIKDNPEKALAYVNHLLGDIGKSEVYSDTGNVAFDSIINFKLKSAKDAGIAVNLDIFTPAVIGIETSDIVIIVGNLLDNALEAVTKVEDKFINIHIVYQKGNLLIKVENSFAGVVKIDEKLDELTTLKAGDGHGYGLKNVRKSAEKYHGNVDVSHEEGIFAVKVLLYGEENH